LNSWRETGHEEGQGLGLYVAGGSGSEAGNDELFDPDSLTYIVTILTALCFSLCLLVDWTADQLMVTMFARL
jgi:hypothetical protein